MVLGPSPEPPHGVHLTGCMTVRCPVPPQIVHSLCRRGVGLQLLHLTLTGAITLRWPLQVWHWG